MRLYYLAECSCHVWVMVAGERAGHCRRCREEPVGLGIAPDDAVSVCKHTGSCHA